MVSIKNEQELALIARALAPSAHLTPAERSLLSKHQAADSLVARAMTELIAAGEDPLGDCLIALRSPEKRRDVGAVYTPGSIVGAMMKWAGSRGAPDRVVDPGAGSGRFIAAAAMRFPKARLIACEIDPLAALLIRANAAVLGFADRLEVHVSDYRILALPKINGPTLYVGNPPYVRHHKIDSAAKTWFAATAAGLGFKASKLAGLHVHFFLRTREIASKGDWGAFITSAEWMDVNYGSVLRGMLADGLGGSSLQVFPATGMPFAEVMTTGAITTFLVGRRPDEFTIRELASAAQLENLDEGRKVSWEEVGRQDRWSQMMYAPLERQQGMVRLGDLFRVHRGAVTGGNGVFVEGAYKGTLPDRFLVPAITKANDLFSAGGRITTAKAKGLRRIISIPADLSSLNEVEIQQVKAFQDWAKAMDAHQSWTAKARPAWWAVRLRDPAPILCTYMGRRPPAFVRNDAGVRHINIAHGLYPRLAMTPAEIDAYATYLSANVSTVDGRTYAGGLTKFEPKEIENLFVPSPEKLRVQSN